MLVLSFGWFGSVKPSGERLSGCDSIRRRIIRFSDMILAPLVLRILQDLELLWRQQRPDLFDGGLSIWLETCPDLLQLAARGLNLCRVLR